MDRQTALANFSKQKNEITKLIIISAVPSRVPIDNKLCCLPVSYFMHIYMNALQHVDCGQFFYVRSCVNTYVWITSIYFHARKWISSEGRNVKPVFVQVQLFIVWLKHQCHYQWWWWWSVSWYYSPVSSSPRLHFVVMVENK